MNYDKPSAKSRKWWLLLVALVLGLLVFFLAWSTTLFWVGTREVTLDVVVVDARTKQPVENAEVRVYWEERNHGDSEGHTGSDGHVVLVQQFKAGGKRGWFSESGSVHFGYGWLVEVSARDYQTSRRPLSDYAGLDRDIHDPSPQEIRVELEK